MSGNPSDGERNFPVNNLFGSPLSSAAAEVTRWIYYRKSRSYPPPHVGGYNFQTRFNSIFSWQLIHPRSGVNRVWRAFFPIILLCWCGTDGMGQTNTWTNSVSGNWEDPRWSLGVL